MRNGGFVPPSQLLARFPRLLRIGNHDPSYGEMTKFTAYFDASGSKHSSKAMFVSGFVSSVDRWLEFEQDWLALLGKYGIENPFHMTDFAVGAKQYESWKHEKRRRLEFVAEAIKLMSEPVNGNETPGGQNLKSICVD